MALLWQHAEGGRRYEVRSAGRSRRLYTDGVFHSQFNEARPLTGAVWDLLLLPAFFHPPARVRDVLVLGVGGGAVLRQIARFVEPGRLVGVELDPVHLQVARRFFAVERAGATLHRADAVNWVRSYRGPPFDLVIDDLFAGEAGEPVRAVRASAKWFDRLGRLLAPEGTLVMNFPSARELRTCGYALNERTRARYAAAFRFTLPQHDNVVAAFLRAASDGRALRRNLAREPGLDPRRRTSRVAYGLRRVG